jgi:ribonuclease G
MQIYNCWILRYPQSILVALLKEQSLYAACVFPNTSKSRMHQLYKAKVKRYIPALQGAFVSLGSAQQMAFLPTQQPLKPGLMQLVQLDRDPVDNKHARCTLNLRVPHPLAIVKKGRGNIFFGETAKQREGRLRALLKPLIPDGCDIIVRRRALLLSEKELIEGVLHAVEQWSAIQSCAQSSWSSAGLVPYPHFSTALLPNVLQFAAGAEHYYVEDREVYNDLQRYWSIVPSAQRPGIAHIERSDVCVPHVIAKGIAQARHGTIDLPSGGNVQLFYAGPLSFIDINMQNFRASLRGLDSFLAMNLKALEHIAGLLRQLNLQGMICIDCISMKRAEDREYLLKKARQFFQEDVLTVKVEGISGMSLLHLTRERLGLPLRSLD